MTKKKKDLKLTLQEIEQGWGSLQAYLEEQRRCGAWQLENYAHQIEKSPTFQARPRSVKPVHQNEVSLAKPEGFAAKIETVSPNREKDYLRFLRWLYISGKIQS